MKIADLSLSIGGVRFKNPFYVASGPTARTVEQLVKIEKCGWAGASIKLSIDPAPYVNRYPRYGIIREQNALAFTAEKRLTFEQGLTLIRDAKKILHDLILFANITYAGEAGVAGWVNMALQFERAGADIIELNMCCPNMSFNMQLTSGDKNASKIKTGASLGQDGDAIAYILEQIKKAVHIPVFVKLTPEGGKIAQIAKQLYEAGADAVGGTANRLGMPPIDLENPEKSFHHLQDEISMSCLCGSWLKPLAQRDTYEIRKIARSDDRIAATGGIRSAKDSIEMIMCGADLLGICTETLVRGYDFLNPLMDEMRAYMISHGYESLEAIRDVIVQAVKSASELTLYKGWARIKNPRLSAPCGVACPNRLPIQAIMKKTAVHDFRGAYELLASSLPAGVICGEGCCKKCVQVCYRGKCGENLQISELHSFLLELGRKNDWHIATKETKKNDNTGEKTALKITPKETVFVRITQNEGVRAVKLGDEASYAFEAARCLNCGCGEGCQSCKELCCEFAIDLNGCDVIIDEQKCVACGMCYNLCPNGNIEMFNTGERI